MVTLIETKKKEEKEPLIEPVAYKGTTDLDFKDSEENILEEDFDDDDLEYLGSDNEDEDIDDYFFFNNTEDDNDEDIDINMSAMSSTEDTSFFDSLPPEPVLNSQSPEDIEKYAKQYKDYLAEFEKAQYDSALNSMITTAGGIITKAEIERPADKDIEGYKDREEYLNDLAKIDDDTIDSMVKDLKDETENL